VNRPVGGLAWRPVAGTKFMLGYRWNRFRLGDESQDRGVLVAGIDRFF
jgi:hypothetical protein